MVLQRHQVVEGLVTGGAAEQPGGVAVAVVHQAARVFVAPAALLAPERTGRRLLLLLLLHRWLLLLRGRLLHCWLLLHC